MSAITAYPLTWPAGWRRTDAAFREEGRFGKRERRGSSSYASLVNLTVADAMRRVLAELEAMGIRRDDLVISTNLPTRLDGMPRSDAANPPDPGVSVWWQTRKGVRQVMAIDRYRRVADNLAAIAATLDAMRAIERHGGAEILERAYTGFAALPAPPGAIPATQARSWRDVLGLTSFERSLTAAEDAYKRLASQWHPDKHPHEPDIAHARMAELNAARAAARKELQA